jgi:uncharacterized membrane protein
MYRYPLYMAGVSYRGVCVSQVMLALGCVLFCASLLTMRKIFSRWWRDNSVREHPTPSTLPVHPWIAVPIQGYTAYPT